MENKELMTKFLKLREATMKLLYGINGKIVNDSDDGVDCWILVVGGVELCRSNSMFYIWKKVAELHKEIYRSNNENF